MGLIDGFLIVVAIGFGAFLLNPRMLDWSTWRAIVTPLASIIGSGFLVAAPILLDAAGPWAFAAMLALCGIGYYYGSAIRHNIIHVEPRVNGDTPFAMWLIEELSDLALSLAYFVSVAYYLNLFAAFALRGLGIAEEFWVRVLASVVIAAIGGLGLLRGLKGLEWVEAIAVGVKLSIIGALSLTLAFVAFGDFAGGEFVWPTTTHQAGLGELQVLLGLVILVQGFETSRYLGHEHNAQMRVKTMRVAQWIATGIYVIFILLATRYFVADLPSSSAETAIIDMLAPVAFVVAPLIIVTAIASQLSAAVADTNGAGGLLAETFNWRISPKLGYAATALVAIAITWSADIFEIITYASKAFVIYYGLQSLQAALWRHGDASRPLWVRRIGYGAGVVFAVIVVVFAVPASV